MVIFFATWLTDKSLGDSLTKKKASKRLVSFHFLKEQKVTSKHIKKYCTTGICNLAKK